MLRIYIYIDDVFQYKTEIFDQSNNPILDLNLRFELLEGSQGIRLDIYDASNLQEDELKLIQKEYTQDK